MLSEDFLPAHLSGHVWCLALRRRPVAWAIALSHCVAVVFPLLHSEVEMFKATAVKARTKESMSL